MLRITIKNGESYTITTEGFIIRDDMPNMTPSGDWLFLGIMPVKAWKLENAISVYRLLTDKELLANLLYKNGNPKYTIVDNDHGTVRVWGNTTYRGISSIEVLNNPTNEA
jgi:hypothetical protein